MFILLTPLFNQAFPPANQTKRWVQTWRKSQRASQPYTQTGDVLTNTSAHTHTTHRSTLSLFRNALRHTTTPTTARKRQTSNPCDWRTRSRSNRSVLQASFSFSSDQSDMLVSICMTNMRESIYLATHSVL